MDIAKLLPLLSPAAALVTGNGGAMKFLSPLAMAAGIGSKGKGGGDIPAGDPNAGAPMAPPAEAPSFGDLADTSRGIDGALARNAAMKKPGMFDGIGDFIKSGDGKAALLRAGAEMLRSGSVGGGVMAGANYVDQRKSDRAKTDADALDRAIRQQQVDQTGQYQQGSLQNDQDRIGLGRDELGEKRHQFDHPSGSDVLRSRTDMARTRIGEEGANYRTGVQADTTRRGQNLDYDLGGRRLDFDRYAHDNVSGDVRYRSDADTQQSAMGIGSKNVGTKKVEYQEEIPGTDGWFSSPQMRTVTEETPILPSQVAPQGQGGQPEIRYDANGQAFVKGPDGNGVRAPQFDMRK